MSNLAVVFDMRAYFCCVPGTRQIVYMSNLAAVSDMYAHLYIAAEILRMPNLAVVFDMHSHFCCVLTYA
jgi:hypothetical protein